MIEKICPIHRVLVYGEKCSKDGCGARPIVLIRKERIILAL